MPTMKIETYLDYETILANQAFPVHFALRFQAEGHSQPRPQPAAFCVVLDRSGSMTGAPLAKAREAAKVAVRNLRGGDQFALVIFDHEARTVCPMQPVRDKTAVLRQIEEIHEGGNTNLTGGWMLGRDQLRQAPAEANRRLLLLSDGHLNSGIIEPDAVRQIVMSGLEADRIRTSCLGFGDRYNEDLMAELARATNGQFYDADAPEKLPAIFESELEGLQKIAVQNLRLRLKPLDFVEGFVPLGEYPSVRLPDGRHEFALGDLVTEEERIVCYALQVLPLPCIAGIPVTTLAGEPLLEIEALYDELGPAEAKSQTYTQTIRIQSTQDPGKVTLNGVVVQWVAMQRAGVVMKEVSRWMDQGRPEEALRVLLRAIEELKRYGPGPETAEAIQALQDLCRRIEVGDWDPRARKRSSYRSASYRKMSSRDLWTGDTPPPQFKQPPPSEPDPPPGNAA